MSRTPRVKLSKQAQVDLDGIGLYIAQNNPAAATRWVAKIQRKYRMLGKHPGLGERCDELFSGSRRTFVGNYIIYYRVEGNTVIVSRIVRGDRDLETL